MPARWPLRWIAAIGLLATIEIAAASAQTLPPPTGLVEANNSLSRFQLLEGLRIELVAAEPEVVDPVAVRFDEDGRMWVVEMRDYPDGPGEGKPPQSRICVLEDNNTDGRYESARTFAEGLLMPTGLQPWRGGVIVTLAGRIAYLKDTDGDGRADSDETWYTGFAEQNSQLRANHPRFALDNHVYVANGLRGGDVVCAGATDAKPVSLSGRDFRFDPRRPDRHEAVSGNGQFGLTHDDFGRRFVCSNRNPLMHVVLEDRYLRRSPRVPVAAVVTDVAASDAKSQVFPLVDAWTTSNLHAGQFTAACGVLIYGGDALPAQNRGAAFICEPTGSLVHAELLTSEGATFASRSVAEGREFLASTDPWFRPVNLTVGPDGGLYVVDMYRAVIEHPEWMPRELQTRPDLKHGNDRGRIYRVVADGSEPVRRSHVAISTYDTPRLVGMLADKNSWQRETAARLLYERQDPAAARPLREMVRDGQAAVARVHALAALAGIDELDDQTLSAALADADPRVQAHAVELAEDRLDASPELRDIVRRLATADDARLRFQVALSLTGMADEETSQSLATLGLMAADDPWTIGAVVLAAGNHPSGTWREVVARLGGHAKRSTHRHRELLERLSELVGSDPAGREADKALDWLFLSGGRNAQPEVQRVALLGLARGLARRNAKLEGLLEDASSEVSVGVSALLDEAAARATDTGLDNDVRLSAIELLAYAPWAVARQPLTTLILTDESQKLRTSAVSALGRRDEQEITSVLLDAFGRQTPAVRSAILNTVITRSDRAGSLLEEVASGRIAAAELGPSRAERLRRHRDPSVRRRAHELLNETPPADRQHVLSEYTKALTSDADLERGRRVFAEHCATCHRVAGQGVDIGPDISDTRTKTAEQLLGDVLDPNRAIDANYISYTIATTDGRALTGIIASESSSSLTLRQADGKPVTLLRSDVDEIHTGGLSLMPVGLEKNISPAQMADLLSFLKNWRYQDGRVAPGAP